ncbi:MotA/TolQ/ExbB proton channel family protein [Candidatus Sumerlaeota bacterium]|nr:MotA/TolQ/ExbB proton channel family protein [Candidatus Sumerlaeota bacterium]
MQSVFQQWVIDGGPIMIVLVPALILTIAFIIQAALTLRRSRLAPQDFVDRLKETATQSGVRAARAALDEEQSSIAEIVRNVDAELQGNPGVDVQLFLREQAEAECDLLLQQNSPLALLARIAPHVGLLGTLIGLHGAFAIHAAADPKAFAQAVSGAIVPAAWSVLITVTAHVAHYLVQRRILMFEQSAFPTEAAAALRALRGES